MLEILSISSVSVTLEIQNDKPFYSGECYDIILNGENHGSTDRNVFSLFGLSPNTDYSLKLGSDHTISFKTSDESFALSVCDFGAKGDGITDDTYAIQTAFAACPKNGRVYFPAGTYLSSPVFPKSNMTVELCEGAELLGRRERERYPVLPALIERDGKEFTVGSWEGNPVACHAALLSLLNLENVIITGRGTLNGNADRENWWIPRSKQLVPRPRLFYAYNCENITLEGITVRNSPSWTIHPHFTNNSKFLSLSIQNPADSPNTDGLDPEFCENILIAGVHFTVGDDCIAIKSGRIIMGEKGFGPTKNIIIRNNLMEFGHGAVVMGSEVGGGISGVHISKCVFNETDRGIRLKTQRGRGKRSVIDGIHMENVLMNRVGTAFAINMYYIWGPDGKSDYVQSRDFYPVDERTPAIGSITVENVTCKDVMTAAVAMHGLPESKIREVVMRNFHVSMDDEGALDYPVMADRIEQVKKHGITLLNVAKVIMNNVTLENCEGEPITLEGVDELVKND